MLQAGDMITVATTREDDVRLEDIVAPKNH